MVELLIVITIIFILAGMLLPALKGAMEKTRQINCVAKLRNIGIAFAGYAGDNKEYYAPANANLGNGVRPWLYHIAAYMGITTRGNDSFWWANGSNSAYMNIPPQFKHFVCDSNEVKYIARIDTNPVNFPYVLTNYVINYNIGGAEPFTSYPAQSLSKIKYPQATGLLWDCNPKGKFFCRGLLNSVNITEPDSVNSVGLVHSNNKRTNLLYLDGRATGVLPKPYLPVIFNGSTSVGPIWEGDAPDLRYYNMK